EEQEYEVIACARTAAKLDKLKAELDPSGTRLTTRTIDLNRSEDLDQIIDEADLVVGATSRWQDSLILANKAVQASTHYCGTYLSNPDKWHGLRELEASCRSQGTMIVDDCGTHPGVPAAMVRRAMLHAPLQAAWVGGKFDLDWARLDLSVETATDFMAEIEATDPSILVEGEWKRGYAHARQFKFKGTQEPANCIPMLMEEMRELAQSGSVPSTGFFIAGFSPFVDYVVIPVSMLLTKINRKASGKLLIWALRRFASRPRYAALQLEAEVEGIGDSIRMVVTHDDPYYITAAPVVETIRQVFSAPKPGVWTQGMFVEPESFFDKLQRMGLDVDLQM
nr:saccharopine dehydrogenase NADP-binding domain-containing protein [Gammaproteobacteria bacterium]